MIKFFIENGIGLLTLNRPEKRNALHPEMVNKIIEVIDKAEEDNSIKVLIITGEGKSFCSGADLEYLNQLTGFNTIENEKDSEKLGEFFLKIYNFSKPTIAAVNGAAIAGGCGLASVCDFVIASPASKFGYSEVKIGFIPAIVSIFLIKRVGEGLTKQLLLSGDIIDGKKAYEIGFVNYLSEDILSEAKILAEKLSNNSSTSMKLTKKMIQNVSNFNVEEAVNYCVKLNTISRNTNDFKNGLEKFLNKK